MSDLLNAALLQQTRQRPRQSASSRLAEQLMRQAGQQGPVFGTMGVLSRALPGVLGAYMAQRADEDDRVEEKTRIGRIEDMAREQREEAANFFRPGGMPAQAPQTPARPPMMPPGGDTPQAPAAPSAVPQGTPGGASWLDRLETAESGGNPNARNPRSTATGNFQFIDGTWREFAAANPTLFQGMSPEQVMAARTDPALGRRAAEWYAGRNAEALRAAGLEPTEANLALAHRFGAAGAAAVLRGDPQAGVASTVPNGAQTLLANPDLRGRSNADVIAQYGRLVTGGSPAMPQAAVPGTAANMPGAGVPNGNPAPMPNAAQPPGIPGLPPGVTMERLREGLESLNPDVRRRAEAIVRTMELARRALPAAPAPTETERLLTAAGLVPGSPEYQAAARAILDRRGQAPQTTVNLPQSGTIPPGFRMEYDESGRPTQLVPIPGGPAAIAEGTRRDAENARTTGRERTGNVVLEDIDRALALLGSSTLPVAGFGAGTMAGIPGTAASDTRALLDTIKANVGFAQLNQMRAESPTGGALGQVTERELAFLQAVLGSLDQSQTPTQFRNNLQRLRQVYTEIIHGPQGVRGPTDGSTAEPPPGPGTQAQPPTQRFRFNPATNMVEPVQ